MGVGHREGEMKPVGSQQSPGLLTSNWQRLGCPLPLAELPLGVIVGCWR